MVRCEIRNAGPDRGAEPGASGPRPWARVRALAAGLTLLAGLTVPALAPSPALADPSENAYVTNSSSDSVSVINTATNTVTATIPIHCFPIGVAVAPDGQ